MIRTTKNAYPLIKAFRHRLNALRNSFFAMRFASFGDVECDHVNARFIEAANIANRSPIFPASTTPDLAEITGTYALKIKNPESQLNAYFP